MASPQRKRSRMVARQIEARGIRSPLVLEAMGTLAREQFVPEHLRDEAYADRPLPIGAGQTISQPYVVAFMIEALELRGGERVLEIGAGSGYAAAVLGRIAGEVWAIERIEALARTARSNLARAGVTNVHVLHADGTEGWPQAAPFDAILVSAGAPDVPQPLLDQLALGGRLLVPVGDDPREQVLVKVTRIGGDDYRRETLSEVRFVPLIGKAGWDGDVTNSLDPD